MTYQCKRCGKTAGLKSSLKCARCDQYTAQSTGDSASFESPLSYSDISDSSISSHSCSDSDYSGGGGDCDGGGSSSD